MEVVFSHQKKVDRVQVDQSKSISRCNICIKRAFDKDSLGSCRNPFFSFSKVLPHSSLGIDFLEGGGAPGLAIQSLAVGRNLAAQMEI
jgi:hypothetical protein